MGSHAFTVTLNTVSPPPQTITVADTVHGKITGTATVTVNPAGAAPPTPEARSGRTDTNAPADGGSPDATALVALLGDVRFVRADPSIHTLPMAANSATSMTFGAADWVPSPITGGMQFQARVGVGTRAPIGMLRGDKPPLTRLALADLEAFFASEARWTGIA
jgi:hypothetical protein